jgi:hypothetical protein
MEQNPGPISIGGRATNDGGGVKMAEPNGSIITPPGRTNSLHEILRIFLPSGVAAV